MDESSTKVNLENLKNKNNQVGPVKVPTCINFIF